MTQRKNRKETGKRKKRCMSDGRKAAEEEKGKIVIQLKQNERERSEVEAR